MLTRVVQAFGLVVAIETDASDLFALLEPQLPPFPDALTSSTRQLTYRVVVRAPGGVTVIRGRRTIATATDVPAACAYLVSDLQSAMARLAAGWTFVHSGVVAIDGHALLMPAASCTGKSTLVAALLRAGASYGSDEFAVLDPAGRVHPYSRQLALRRPHQPVTRVPANALGGQVLTERLPVAAVLFTEYQDGARLHLHSLSPGEVVLRLLQHSLGVRGRPAETLAALRALVSGAAGFAGARGEADVAARALIERARFGWPAKMPAGLC